MRILLSCLQSLRRHNVPAYAFWEPYFKRGIEEAGHEWIDVPGVDWAEGLVHDAATAEGAAWRERTWTRTAEFAATCGADLFLGYLFPRQVDPSAVRVMQAAGLPCVNFYCDNVRDFQRVPQVYRPFDLHWVPEFAALAMYEQAGLRHLHAAMPCWIPPEQRTWDHPDTYGPTFVGSRDEQRERLFADVLARGGPVTLRGPEWLPEDSRPVNPFPPVSAATKLARQVEFVRDEGPAAWVRKMAHRSHMPVPDHVFAHAAAPSAFGEAYVRVLQQSEVSIGVNRYPTFRHPFSRPDTYSRLRDVEAPMMGACYLTEHAPGLDKMYDVGQEVETYRDADEMIEAIRRLQADPAKRRSLRRRGQERALRDHSVAESVRRIVADVLGPAAAPPSTLRAARSGA